jgi:hypothetical protein
LDCLPAYGPGQGSVLSTASLWYCRHDTASERMPLARVAEGHRLTGRWTCAHADPRRAPPRSKLGATNVCTCSNETGAEETGRRRASDRELAFKPLSSALVASSLDAGHQIVPSSRRPDDSANPLSRHVADARRRHRERPGAVGERVGGHCRAIGPAAKCHATLWSSDENPAAIAAHISAWCYSLKM